MYIQKVDPNRESFGDYSLKDAVLTIGGITVDLEAEQEDQEVIITFSDHNGMIHRGMMPCCRYVAEVIIPPRRYELIEVENTSINEDDGEEKEMDEEPGRHTENVPVSLDIDSVVLKLWPEENGLEEAATAEGENNAE
ncbi:MAG: hypothetical protein LBQ88_15930 [Treponema sp.]|jgi:hypothetical protein|nr:hypothetical protein [Treponema sp.]